MRRLLPLLLVALVLIFSGCLEAKKYSDISYDAKTDTFRILRIYYQIDSGEKNPKDDLTYLVNLSNNRDHILPMDVIGFLVETAQLRLDAKTYYSISLGTTGQKPTEPTTSPMDLSKIVNKPGKFFMSGENSLGYYHQVEVPGAQLDEVLKSVNDEMRTSLAKTLDSEMARRKNGGEVGTWDKIRDEMIAKLGAQKEPAPAPTAEEVEAKGQAPFNCLSEDSLKLIQKAVSEKQIGIARKGSEFSLGMPATAEDRKGFMGLRDAVKNKLRQALEADAKDPKTKTVMDVLDAVSIVNDEKSGQIATTADFVKVRKALQATPGLFDLEQKADPAKAEAMAAAVAAMKEAGLEIDDKIKLADIPKLWEEGKLPVSNPKKSLEPGTGLFKAPEAPRSSTPAPNPAPEQFIPAN